MEKYFYIHREYFDKYYPAKISIGRKHSETVIFVRLHGVDYTCHENSKAKEEYLSRDLRDFYEVETFKTKSQQLESFETGYLNTWFFTNTTSGMRSYRFVTKEEKKHLKLNGGFVSNGPPFEDIQRIITLLHNYYLKILNHDRNKYIEIETGVGVGILHLLEEGRKYYLPFQRGQKEHLLFNVILKAYPNISIATKSSDNFATDLVSESEAYIAPKLISTSRELLHLEKELRELLIKYHLEDILPRKIFLSL